MKIRAKGFFKSFCFSVICSTGLIVSGCSSSNDSAVPPVTPSAVETDIYDVIVVEGADDLEFVVSLSSASNEVVKVDYATADGTAVAGTDYSAVNGTVQFAPGEVRKFVTVSVLDNNTAQTTSSKAMQLVLSNPQNAELDHGTATGTIVDRDTIFTDTTFTANWADTGTFTNATQCAAGCHESSNTLPAMFYDNKDISAPTRWQHSVMAHAFNDPYWQAAVEDEADSFPQLAGFIEDTCTKCHAPMGRTHAYHDDDDLTEYRMAVARTEDHAREGVSCTVCHQIDDSNLGTADSFSGGFTIEGDSSETDYKNVYGPYGSPVGSNMESNTGHKPVEGAYVAESELCATCHTLYTPTIDPDTGTPTGTGFLEQGPYLEWQNSVYTTGAAQEAQCQDCHMPEPAAMYETAISLLPNTSPLRTPYRQHTLLGGNAHLLEILRDYRTELGIASSTTTAGFDEQIALTQDFLGSSADIAVSTPASVGDNIEFSVDVTNHAGHKIPSAYPSRRAWLHVLVKNGANQIIFESGKPDSRGYISTDEARLKADCMAGHKFDGFDSSLCYEPHRDVITDPSQIAIYETVLGDSHDYITHILLQSSQYLKDNRIPPDGFTNSIAATIEPQTVPAGVTGDSNFNCGAGTVNEGCGMDTVKYQVNTEGQTGPYSVEASLLYQATQPGFVDGLHNAGDRVNRFKVMYDRVPPSVEVLATATATSP